MKKKEEEEQEQGDDFVNLLLQAVLYYTNILWKPWNEVTVSLHLTFENTKRFFRRRQNYKRGFAGNSFGIVIV